LICAEPLILQSFRRYLECQGLSLVALIGDEGASIAENLDTADNLKGPWGEALFAFLLLQCSSPKPITDHPLFAPLKDTLLKDFALVAQKVSFEANTLLQLLKRQDTTTILVTGKDGDLHTDIVVLLRSIHTDATLPLTASVKVRSNRGQFYKGLFLDSNLQFAMRNRWGDFIEPDSNIAKKKAKTIEKYLQSAPGSLCISFHWLPASFPEVPQIVGKDIYYLLTQNSKPLQDMLPKSTIVSLNNGTCVNTYHKLKIPHNTFEDKRKKFFATMGDKPPVKRGRPATKQTDRRGSQGQSNKKMKK